MAMKALVTGANGFIGSNLVRALRTAGFEVRALVRRESDLRNLEGLDVTFVYGDVRDPASAIAAIAGCDVLFHTAARYTYWAPDPNEIYRINVDGTRNLLSVALEAGIDRVVYTSTVSTIGPPKPGEVSTEEAPLSLDDLASAYKRSKYLAEQEAIRFYRETGLPVVIVNPTTPVGRGDLKPTPTGKMILDFLNGKMFAYIETGLNLIDVEDVAIGHLQALERGRPGERYLLGHQNMSLLEIFKALAKITGLPAPRLRLPYGLALGIAHINTFVSGRLLRRPPRVPVEAVCTARKPMYVNCDKAVQELGLPQTPIEKALEKAIRWFVIYGYVRRNRLRELKRVHGYIEEKQSGISIP